MKRVALLLLPPLLAGCGTSPPAESPAAAYYTTTDQEIDHVPAFDDVTDRFVAVPNGTPLEFVRQKPGSRALVMRVLGGPLKGRQIAFTPECITSDRPPLSP